MRLGDILKAGGWDNAEIPTAAGVVGAESGFRSTVRNAAPCGTRKDGSKAHAIGLMQVCTVHLDPGGLLEGWTEEDLENPVANVRAGKIVFDAQGWGAWTTHTTGAFRRYPTAQTRDIPAASLSGGSLSDSARSALGLTGGLPNPLGLLPDIPNPLDLIPGVDDIKDAASTVGDAASALGKIADVFSNVFTTLTNPDTWWRVGKGYLGGTLIILGTAGLVFVVAKSVANSAPAGAGKAIKAVT